MDRVDGDAIRALMAIVGVPLVDGLSSCVRIARKAVKGNSLGDPWRTLEDLPNLSFLNVTEHRFRIKYPVTVFSVLPFFKGLVQSD